MLKKLGCLCLNRWWLVAVIGLGVSGAGCFYGGGGHHHEGHRWHDRW